MGRSVYVWSNIRRPVGILFSFALLRGILILRFSCSQYRGSTVEFNTCLNLSNPQFVSSTNPKAPPPVRNEVPFKPRFGPHPAINPAPGQQSAAGFRPAPPSRYVSLCVCVPMTCQDVDCLVVNLPMCTSCQIRIEVGATSRMVVELHLPMPKPL